MRRLLEDLKKDGASGSKVRFFEKMLKMEEFELAMKLNLQMGTVQETFKAIKAEFKNFA